jgi:hypothetical protein
VHRPLASPPSTCIAVYASCFLIIGGFLSYSRCFSDFSFRSKISWHMIVTRHKDGDSSNHGGA